MTDVDQSDADPSDYDPSDDDPSGEDGDDDVASRVLDYLARQLVDQPDAVHVESAERSPGHTVLSLHVAGEDMGQVIGRRGRVAQSIRAVVRAAASRDGQDVTVDIVD